jgi:hypothetical protein
MSVNRMFPSILLVVVASVFCTQAWAQSSVHFQISGSGHVDCDQPIHVTNFPITVHGSGAINSDRSAAADVDITEFIFVNRIHFDGRLGARPTSAPGGTSQVRVAGRDRLRLIWSLPNNQITLDILVRGRSCSVALGFSLKRGMRQYSLYDGHGFHYCGKPRVEQTACSVN